MCTKIHIDDDGLITWCNSNISRFRIQKEWCRLALYLSHKDKKIISNKIIAK